MKELSLNILDIAENSYKAKATLVSIILTESAETLEIEITDDGVGMTEEVLSSVENPFYTTRTTRKVGMGIPLFKFASEQTGGKLKIISKDIASFPEGHGTTVTALFYKNHIDFTPLGDVVSTVATLVQGHPEIDLLFIHRKEGGEIKLDTREMREVLEGIPLDTFEVIKWIRDNLAEQYNSIS